MSQDFFKLLNIKTEFDLDLNELDRNYFQLQRQFHPDQYVNIEGIKDTAQKLEYSAKINEAYATLKSPVSRAAYLLSIQGVEMNENTSISDPELLEKSIEDRDVLQEVDELSELEKFEEEVLLRQSSCFKEFSEYYKNTLIRQAMQVYIQLKYITRLLEEISQKKRFISYATTHNK
ncbi:MAG: Fe-S protein assembly co-chaperone HscB [Rickettsiales endosymbiont of Dermacentor nuttalli]